MVTQHVDKRTRRCIKVGVGLGWVSCRTENVTVLLMAALLTHVFCTCVASVLPLLSCIPGLDNVATQHRRAVIKITRHYIKDLPALGNEATKVATQSMGAPRTRHAVCAPCYLREARIAIQESGMGVSDVLA